MHRRSDLFGISFICVYLVVCLVWANSFNKVSYSSPKKEVLGSRIERPAPLPENNELPSLNTLHEASNATRKSVGLSTLQTDSRLISLAQSRADDMAKRNYYAHQNPDGLYYYDQFIDNSFSSNFSCENLALDATLVAQTFLNQWLESTKGHKECLLKTSITHVGYGTSKLSVPDSKLATKDTYIVVAIYAVAP